MTIVLNPERKARKKLEFILFLIVFFSMQILCYAFRILIYNHKPLEQRSLCDLGKYGKILEMCKNEKFEKEKFFRKELTNL